MANVVDGVKPFNRQTEVRPIPTSCSPVLGILTLAEKHGPIQPDTFSSFDV
ncbi:unnamed protein product [Schistosoma mattheei]|uniref:DUF433 domain-containing protein n=2 Tax=Schistosoma TaxID=6181 RepID=A0A183KD59_9TREM|nr:unnamed protein product [Schistosoma curassoni]VDP82694.1 unnamed protein product [Schistosoma mattheei]